MPFGLSDARATLTIDAGGFVSGVQQAAAGLDALDASGSRAAQSSMTVETHLQSAAQALERAAGQSSSYEQALASAAAAAGSTAARVDALALKTDAARAAFASAQQSVSQSSARLEELQQAAQISSENISEVRAELEALQHSGSGAEAEIAELSMTLKELTDDAADIDVQIGKETQSLHKNGDAAAQAAAKYNSLLAQLQKAEVAADRADGKFVQLTDTMGNGTGLNAFADSLGSWGTSTLTSASRSLSSMAVSAMNLTSGTVGSTLATNGLSEAMRTLTKLAGPYGIAISGAVSLAALGVKKLTDAWNDSHDAAGKMQEIIDNAADNSYTAALKNINVELSDEDGIKTQISEKLQHCFDTLTDGKADTPKIVTGLHTDIDEEYSGIRAQVEQYFTDAIAGAETEAAKAALIAKQDEILASIDATQAAANGLVDSYAGKSTEVCKAAKEEIDAVQQQVNDLIAGLNTAKQLLDSQYGDSYAKVSGGYYATQQDIEWSLTYIQADKTNSEAQAKKQYEAAMTALNDAFKGKDGSTPQEIEYEVDGVSYKMSGSFDELTHQVENEYQGALDTAQNEMIARWNAMLQGLAESGSLGSEATAAFAKMADALDVQSVMTEMAGKIADGSATDADWAKLGADFWGKAASVLGMDGAQAQEAINLAEQGGNAAKAVMLATWSNGISEALTSSIGALQDSGFGELFAAAMESGLMEGVNGLDMEDALTRMQAMVGALPVELEPEIKLPTPEELYALYGNEGITGVEIQPQITLPDPEELTAMGYEPIRLPVEAELTPEGGGLVAAVEAMQAHAQEPLSAVESDFSGAGDNAGSAFVSALRGYLGPAANAGAAIAAAALGAMKARLNIHNPSRETFKLGLQTGEGFSLGIQERTQLARASMQRMANAALRGAESARSINNSRSVTINLNGATIRSDDDVRKLARAIGRYSEDANYGIT